MAGAQRVHIGLLEEDYIPEHGAHIYGTPRDGVGILQVGTLEEHALAIDVYALVCRYFDVAESAKNEVLETLEEGILVSDNEGNIVYTNAAARNLFEEKEPKKKS